MKLDLIEILKTSTYSPKDTKNTKHTCHLFTKCSKHLKEPYFQNNNPENQRVMLIVMALFILLRATQPN